MQMQRKLAAGLLAAMMLIAGAKTTAIVAEGLKPYFSGSPMHESYREERTLQWAMLNASEVNVRSGPGLNHKALFQLSAGCAVEILGEKNGWVNCLHWTCKDPVWIWGEYLTVVEGSEH